MMSTVFVTLSVVVTLLSLPFDALSKTNIDDNADDNYDLDVFDTIIATYMRERRIPGASVAVAKNGRFFVSKGYGRASVQRLMTPWALVRIGSISKVVTSVAVMKLVEEGRVQLQTRVFGATGLLADHSPVSDERILNITVLDLLQHSTGWDHRLIGDPLFMPSLHRVRPVENSSPSSSLESAVIKDNIVRFMMNQTLQYKPGTRYSYSNFGYTVLGLVIERVSGRKYEQYMRDILRKIGIYRMKLVGAKRSDVDIFEVQYFARDDPFASNTGSSADRTVPPSISVTADRLNMAALDSSSGWIATAADLVRLLESLAGSVSSTSVRGNPTASAGSAQHSILRPETVRIMLTRPTYSAEPILPSPTASTISQPPAKSSMPTSSKAWYGLGLVVEDGGQTFWHSGTLEDSTGVVAHDGISGFTWSALLNCRLEPTNDLGDFMRYAVRQVFFGWTSLTPTQLSSSTASSSPSTSVSAVSSDQQHDSSGADHHLVGRSAGSNVLRSNDVVTGDDDDVAGGAKPGAMTSPLRLALSRLVDTLSADGRTAVKLMVADYRVEELVNSLGTFGYRPTWLDAYDYRGQIFFNVIWTRNDDSFRWRIYFDLTPSRYRKRFRARVVQGFRLSHVETYVSRRKMRFAAIFVRDTWPEWTAYEGVSTQRHRAEYYRHLRDGYRLVVQSVTEYQGQLYVAAIYDKLYLGDSRVRLGLSIADFSDELERQLAAGRVMSYVQAYEHRGLVRFSAVWTPKTTRHWAASHAMSKYTTLNKLVDYSSVNVPLISIAAYVDDDGGLYFAALWR